MLNGTLPITHKEIPDMARTWLSAILLTFSVFLVACGGSAGDSASAFVGDWAVDKQAMKEIITKAMEADPGDIPEAQKQMMMDMIPDMIESMEMNLTIAKDGTFTGTSVMMGDTDTTTGTWAAADGTITMTENDSEEAPANATVSGDRLTITFDINGEGPDEIIMIRAE